MIVTTTPDVAGRNVSEYLGIVLGEAVIATSWRRDILAGLKGIAGGRSGAYEDNVREGREVALREMQEEAEKLGADAVIGVDLDFEAVSDDMMMVSASGTAVKLE
jgi:uncharacterized protein YbjQ (UPF0145 family)